MVESFHLSPRDASCLVHGSSSTAGSPCDSSVQSHKRANHTGFPNERTDGNGYPNGHTAAPALPADAAPTRGRPRPQAHRQPPCHRLKRPPGGRGYEDQAKTRRYGFTATLIDSKATRDFISLLPLNLTLVDFAGTEKISDLPRRLSTEGAPSGSDPSVGDMCYYAPWGNLAIFYGDSGYASGLVILGTIDSGIEAPDVPGSVKVTIELISGP